MNNSLNKRLLASYITIFEIHWFIFILSITQQKEVITQLTLSIWDGTANLKSLEDVIGTGDSEISTRFNICGLHLEVINQESKPP